MFKKLLSIAMATTMVVAMAGCGNSTGTNSSSTDFSDIANNTANRAIEADEFNKLISDNADVYKTFVTLGNYKNIDVTVDKSVLEVTDEAVESSIQSILKRFVETEEIKEGVVENGDTVIMDYSGKKDGVAFSGGTATDVTYTVGSGRYIEDLDQGLIGLTVGVETDVPCTFPADYSSAELAGQDVIFTVTVTAKTKEIVPELTDAWVAEHKDSIGADVTTVDGLYSYTREFLENNAKSTYDADKFGLYLQQVVENSTITGYPQAELDYLAKIYQENVKASYDQYASYYTSMGIASYADYLKQSYGLDSEAAFSEYAKEQCKEYLNEKMAITLIAVENSIGVSADELNELGEQWAKDYGYDNYAAILDEYGKEMNSEVGFELLSEKVIDYANTVINEIEGSAETTTTASN